MKKNNAEGNRRLRFALPKGSLNTTGRWSTESLLKEAGFDIKGYSPESRSYSLIIANDEELEAIVDRPQNMPADLRDSIIDLAIMGKDIAEEWNLADARMVRLCSLGYGYADLVLAGPSCITRDGFYADLKREKEIRLATEYPLITQDWLENNESYILSFGNKKPLLIAKYGITGANEKIRITESYGATESAIAKGSADFIVECISSGETLAKNELKPIEILLQSSAGLYTTEDALSDPWKADKIGFVRTLLQGAVKARDTDYIIFNVRKSREEKIKDYLQKERLFSKEPTVIRDGEYLQVGIEIARSRWTQVAYGLRSNGAEDIVRMNPVQIID
ncbi:hypothetical protein GF345_03375 [Candidatus Woesearchaeota archaeon]|nr:hypothetical protein [Candidatus Woesearchaeota archaeon]